MDTSSRSKSPPVAWGVLGAARIAAAKTIPAMLASSWCEAKAIAARDLPRAKAIAVQFGIPKAYGSYEALLDDPTIEAVYIALPNHLHVMWALAAARKGKHVLCEKPMAMTAAEARELHAAPRDVKISEAFMVRQQPRWEALRELLSAGTYGKPMTVQSLLSFFMNNPDDFRNRPQFGGGALYDLGCYTAMAARYVFEEEPARVMAVAERDANGVDVFATAVLDFGAGRHAAFTVSTAMASAQTLHVVCEKGFVDLPKPYVPPRSEPSQILVDTSASHDLSMVEATTFPAADQYELEVTNFSKIVRGHSAPFFGPDDAIANMRVLDAIFAAIRSGGWQAV